MLHRLFTLTILERLVATGLGGLAVSKPGRSCRFAGIAAFSALIAGPRPSQAFAGSVSGGGEPALHAISLKGSLIPPIRADLAEGHWDGIPRPPHMVLVPSGSFTMGDGVALCGADERLVTLTRDFWIGQYEVTNQSYLNLLQWAYDNGYVTATSASVRDNLDGSSEELVDLDSEDCELAFSDGVFTLREAHYPLVWGYPDGYDPAAHPVLEVTWYGAVAYCDWLSLAEGLPRAYDHSTWVCGGGDPYSAAGYRLPTDAEWEYAAQWNDERIYPWGNEDPHWCGEANYTYCVDWTSPVGNYREGVQPNLSEPLYDMAGNLFEWVNDWSMCDLGMLPEIDPAGPESGSRRVMRGGCWMSSEYYLRASDRNSSDPGYRDIIIGFRPARSD